MALRFKADNVDAFDRHAIFAHSRQQNDSVASHKFPLPADIEVVDFSIAYKEALTSGEYSQWWFLRGGTWLPPVSDLSVEGTRAIHDILNIRMAKSAAATDANMSWMAEQHSLPLNDDINICFMYRVAGEPNMDLYSSGDGSANLSPVVGTTYYVTLEAGADKTTTEAETQILWPSAGVFYLSCARIATGADNTITLTLRKNGVDTALVWSADSTAGAWAWSTDYSTQVSIAAGDLINIKLTNTGGVATTCYYQLTLGFRSNA